MVCAWKPEVLLWGTLAISTSKTSFKKFYSFIAHAFYIFVPSDLDL